MVVFVLTAVGVAYGVTVAGKKVRRYRRKKRLQREQEALALARGLTSHFAITNEYSDQTNSDYSRDSCSDTEYPEAPSPSTSERGGEYVVSAPDWAPTRSPYNEVGDRNHAGKRLAAKVRVSVHPPKVKKKQSYWGSCLKSMD